MRRALSALALALVAAPVSAGEDLWFRSPSGNIHCVIAAGPRPVARCDLLDFTPSFRRRPPDCDLDWGHAFEVAGRGPAGLVCAGDTVAVQGAPVLDYGHSVTLGGITCRSERTGMTCTNRDGRGFSIARARQSLF